MYSRFPSGLSSANRLRFPRGIYKYKAHTSKDLPMSPFVSLCISTRNAASHLYALEAYLLFSLLEMPTEGLPCLLSCKLNACLVTQFVYSFMLN